MSLEFGKDGYDDVEKLLIMKIEAIREESIKSAMPYMDDLIRLRSMRAFMPVVNLKNLEEAGRLLILKKGQEMDKLVTASRKPE